MNKNSIQSGFTFLEVMIAVAVIAIALVTLIGSQSQSVSIAAITRQNIIASLLAQQKLTELESLPFDDLYSATGDFEEDYANYHWQAEVNTISEDETGIEGADDLLKSIDLSISLGDNDQQIYSLRSIVMKQIVAGNP